MTEDGNRRAAVNLIAAKLDALLKQRDWLVRERQRVERAIADCRAAMKSF